MFSRPARLLTAALKSAFLVVVFGPSASWAGPLDPPAAPASTDGVRGPGIPISSLPFTISQGGYYYVTRPLSLASGNGITITVSNVTVDLGGFTLTGGGLFSGKGIVASGPRNVTIRNGAMRSWNTGIDLGVTYGRIERVQASSNTNGIITGGLTVVEDCTVTLNNVGIIGSSPVIVRRSSIAENSANGVDLTDRSVVEGSQIKFNGYGVLIRGAVNVIRENHINSSTVADFFLFAASRATTFVGNAYCNRVAESGASWSATPSDLGGICAP